MLGAAYSDGIAVGQRLVSAPRGSGASVVLLAVNVLRRFVHRGVKMIDDFSPVGVFLHGFF